VGGELATAQLTLPDEDIRAIEAYFAPPDLPRGRKATTS
jgi:hypothetical protein